MNDLYRALGDINSIRRQVANTTEFRGYGPATLATTAAFAIVAGTVQQLCLPDAGKHIFVYLTIWISTALLSAVLTSVQMHTRARRMHSGLSDEMIRMAVEQFLPSIVAGLLVTAVLLGSAPQTAWVLPGVWQIIYSLGIFSSCRFLPRAIFTAGGWYLITGLACIAIGDFRAFSPAAMAVPFAVGQLFIAGVLLFSENEARNER
ncbi:MAG: hypothetical protein ACJ746_04015 [Bryobacteraceae bacterium]